MASIFSPSEEWWPYLEGAQHQFKVVKHQILVYFTTSDLFLWHVGSALSWGWGWWSTNTIPFEAWSSWQVICDKVTTCRQTNNIIYQHMNSPLVSQRIEESLEDITKETRWLGSVYVQRWNSHLVQPNVHHKLSLYNSRFYLNVKRTQWLGTLVLWKPSRWHHATIRGHDNGS